MTAPDTARAFAAAEAAYLEPPLLDAEAINAEDDAEPDYEREAEEREEVREERWSR